MFIMLQKSVQLYTDISTRICTYCAAYLSNMPLKVTESIVFVEVREGGGGGGGGRGTPTGWRSKVTLL